MTQTRWLCGLIVLGFSVVAIALTIVYLDIRRQVPGDAVGSIHGRLAAAAVVRFFVLGDSGMGNEDQLAVARAMEQRCAQQGLDGIIHVGDVFYPEGVESVDDPKWQSRVFGPYGSECLSDKPFYSVFGNHDYSGDATAELEVSLTNPRWVKPHRFYERSFGDLVQLIAFDVWFPDFCFDPAQCTIDFLLETLEQRDTQWRIVFAHYPMSSAGRSTALRGWLLRQLLCGRDVDLYLAGHDHHLEYRELDDCNPGLIISGGGGGALYPVHEGQPESRFVKSSLGFAELEITASALTIRFFDQAGRQLFETHRKPTSGFRLTGRVE